MDLRNWVISIATLLSVFGRIESVGLDVPCSADTSCTDTVNHVCESVCKVKANEVATGCSGASTNCPTNAACQADAGVCTCNDNYIADSNGLCVSILGMVCSNNAECGVLAHTQCVIMSPCTKGRCYCADGYTGSPGTACTVDKKGHGEACGETDTCIATTTCKDGTCQCQTQGHAYREAIGQCTDKKLFQETCDTVSECHANIGGNAVCDETCTCTSGYIACTATQMCRAPVRDESCESTPACGLHTLTSVLLPGETSSVAPQCSGNGTCMCAADESKIDRGFMGACYKLCLAPYLGNLKGLGKPCTQFNECQSKVCYQCPEDDTPLCRCALCDTSHATPMTIGPMKLVGLLTVFMILL